MHQETITYENFNGVQVKENHMFNITKAELMQMELSEEGSYQIRLQKLIDTKDVKELIRLFTGLIDISYGIKSEDGKHFRKSPEILANFKDTNAYAELYMSLVSDADHASRFVNGIFPKDLIEQAKATPEYQAQIRALGN